jgi:hypothetical protein
MERWRRISHALRHRKVTQIIKTVDKQSRLAVTYWLSASFSIKLR